MVDKSTRASLASYLGKYATKVFVDHEAVIQSDAYAIASYCRVKIPTEDGSVYQNVKIGPTELYTYPEGDQTKEAAFSGILDDFGRFIPCERTAEGNIEIEDPNQGKQVILSGKNSAEKQDFPLIVFKMDYLEQKPVFQSEEHFPSKDGATFREAEGYTVSHCNQERLLGPIEYYTYPKNGKGKPEFYGILDMSGKLTPCTRNADGDFEFEDENHQKQVVTSAENEIKKDPEQPYSVLKTDYFMNHPVYQQQTFQQGMEMTATEDQKKGSSEEQKKGSSETAETVDFSKLQHQR